MDDNKSLYWIGIKESEINSVKELFCGSITMYGSNLNNNFAYDKSTSKRINCNGECTGWIEFVNETVERIIENDPDCKFLQYYPADYPYYSQNVKDRIVYMNNIQLIEFLENKLLTKIWLSEHINELPFLILKGDKINFKNIASYFDCHKSFVVQANESCSGSGTWFLNKSTEENLKQKIVADSYYLITPYIDKSISINIHLVIYKDNFCILTPSVQLIKLDNNCFSYSGADFLAFNEISIELKQKVISQAEIIGKHIQELGYLGVCGIDFIVTKNDVYFMEINSRFQSSTTLLNLAYRNESISKSVQKLHIEAFNLFDCPKTDLYSVKVPYSFYYYKYKKQDHEKLIYQYLLKYDNNCNFFIIDDNLDWQYEFEENSYLFEILCKNNISSISPEMKLLINQNIDTNSGILACENPLSDLVALKIMLLNQGVRISDEAKEFSKNNGGLNYEEFDAVDMKICNKYINVPYKTKTSDISPFYIDVDEYGKYLLSYFGKYLTNIDLRKQNIIGLQSIGAQFISDDITYLSNDRLRIYYKNGCCYKDNNIGCKFCDIERANNDFSWDDIQSSLDLYWDCKQINHYLIGGGSDSTNTGFHKIIKIANYIREHNKKPIMIMTLPPSNLDILYDLKFAGINEVIFNIEIFDRNLAEIYMPGKGKIPIEIYLNALKKSVEIFGSNGNVRTMFIVGLESETSLLKGIETVCKLGVYPTLSLLKPIEGTPIEHLMPPSNSDLYSLYKKITNICKKYDVHLGPNCKYCEDNVLKI